MTTTAGSIMTAEELERLSEPGKRFELVRGRLVVREPPSGWHGRVSARLTIRVGLHVEKHALGEVLQDSGFRIRSDPDTVRGPDLAFVAADRVAQIGRSGFPRLAPDLVAEVRSPDDRPGVVLAKVADWIDTGTKIVWVIDPARFEARVYRADGSESHLAREDSLDGEDVLPGFTCPLREILE
ncbi:MAG TPA: Uma2 family endonuclease [Gemmatimonadaceae bacterium]|nr:Uma2 family endonuclease [Gemmatimonadaceae bacterium]